LRQKKEPTLEFVMVILRKLTLVLETTGNCKINSSSRIYILKSGKNRLAI